jgi:hypothetical protein
MLVGAMKKSPLFRVQGIFFHREGESAEDSGLQK